MNLVSACSSDIDKRGGSHFSRSVPTPRKSSSLAELSELAHLARLAQLVCFALPMEFT